MNTRQDSGASKSDSGFVAAAVTESDLLTFARSGLSGDASPEAMLWDDLDLDDPDDCRFGDYALLERIGRGGMGVVFRASQLSLGREVAVKFIVGHLAEHPRAVARFLAEARAAARLHHPQIVPVFEVGSVDGMHFFSMPLLRGQTLAQRIGAQRMSPAQSIELLLKLGAAVEYAHSLGLLHLDLKPANVLFDEHKQPLIGDFGLARHMDDDGGVDAQDVSGTPGYMAPEQIDAGAQRRLSRRTDVYALGAILYELLTGIPPSRSAATTLSSPRPSIEAIAPPRSMDAAIDRDLEAICLHCLATDPQQRYQSVADLNADLARCRDGNTVSVRSPGWGERVSRSLRRHPALTLVSAAAIAALVFGLAATSWQWQRAERERVEADQQRSLAAGQATQLKQLAGLMAAAFPAEERASSARDAVTWLKKHAANDPAMQRAVLTAFSEALTAANKGDAVGVLMNEIADQLGEDYREQLVRQMAMKGDRDSLIAAALIGLPRGVDGVSSAAHEAVLQRLFTDHASDPVALYLVALACHLQPQPCPHPEYYARLTTQFPDNAVHWVLVPNGSKPTAQETAVHVLHAAAAKDFDDRLATYTGVLRVALRDQKVPESLLEPMQAVVDESEVAPSLRRNAVEDVPLPMYRDFVRTCAPASVDALRITGLRDACISFAEKGMHSRDATILARMISSTILRRFYKGTPLENEATQYRRDYAWLDQVVFKALQNEPAKLEQVQQDVVGYGEWEAWQRQAERQHASRTPPPGWVPANPDILLLPEDRASAAHSH